MSKRPIGDTRRGYLRCVAIESWLAAAERSGFRNYSDDYARCMKDLRELIRETDKRIDRLFSPAAEGQRDEAS